MFKKGVVTALFLLFSSWSWAAEYWIDVRIPEQYEAKHLEGAINIPLQTIPDVLPTMINKDDVIHVYCNSGRQSRIALNGLTKMGYTNVIDEGGLEELLKRKAAETK